VETRVRKLIIGLALAAGCHSAASMPAATATEPVVRSSGSQTGAATARGAITEFMAAIKDQDLQALGAIWGDKDGPARDRFSQDDLQKRELIMFCYLKHDSFAVLGDAPSLNANRTYAVQVKSGPITHTAQMVVTRTSNGRYYVQSVPNIQVFEDVCAAK
jgi:hypothetical protein